jgi:hypothetical protein
MRRIEGIYGTRVELCGISLEQLRRGIMSGEVGDLAESENTICKLLPCSLICYLPPTSHQHITMTRDLTLLEQLENSGVKVDVDSYHLSWIKAVPFTPHDVTSNQIVIQQQMLLPENKEIIEKTVKEMKDKDWLDIHTVLVSLRLRLEIS